MSTSVDFSHFSYLLRRSMSWSKRPISSFVASLLSTTSSAAPFLLRNTWKTFLSRVFIDAQPSTGSVVVIVIEMRRLQLEMLAKSDGNSLRMKRKNNMRIMNMDCYLQIEGEDIQFIILYSLSTALWSHSNNKLISLRSFLSRREHDEMWQIFNRFCSFFLLSQAMQVCAIRLCSIERWKHLM